MAKSHILWQFFGKEIANKYKMGNPIDWQEEDIEDFITTMEVELKEIFKKNESKAKKCKAFPNIDSWQFDITTGTFKRYFQYDGKTSSYGSMKNRDCFAVLLGYNSVREYMKTHKIKNRAVAPVLEDKSVVDNQEEKATNQKTSTEKTLVIDNKYLTLPPLKSSKYFIGRDGNLEELYELLQAYNNIVLMNGIGGIGKTALAEAYWHQYESEYQYLIWITVNTDIKTSLVNNRTLLNTLGIQTYEGQQASEIFEQIKQKLANLKGKKLLVIDNANDPEDLRKYKSLFNIGDWKILLTSRSQIKIDRFEEYKVDFLSESSAKKLFCYFYAPAMVQEHLLDKLLKYIGYHTLTIELLAKSLSKLRNYSLQDLCNNLQERGLLHPEKRKKIDSDYAEDNTYYEQIIIAMFNISDLDDYPKWLLLQFSVLPSIYISFERMSNFLQINEETEEKFEESLDELVEKGWLSYDEVGSYRIHQVIQEVVREKIKPTSKNCKILINSIKEDIYIDGYVNTFSELELLPFAEKLLICLENKDSNDIGFLWNNTSIVYYYLGEYEKALKFCSTGILIILQRL